MNFLQVNKRKNGFSLLEILVVIGIIAILLSVGLSSYSTLQRKSRDAKRKADIKTIQQAQEQYYSICGFVYPTYASGTIDREIYCANPSMMILPTNKLPLDPKSGQPYSCVDCTTGTNYSVCANESEIEPTPCVSSQQ